MVQSKAAKIEQPHSSAEGLPDSFGSISQEAALNARTRLSLSAWELFQEGKVSPASISEIENFFGFTATQDGASTPKTFEFKDSHNQAVRVEISNGKATHRAADGIETSKDSQGVVRHDAHSDTCWSSGKVEVNDHDGNRHFRQTPGMATLDWGHYEIQKSGPDKYTFRDKTGREPVCEYDGDTVRKQVGPAIYHMIHAGTLEAALREAKHSPSGNERLVFTDGKGNTLIYNPADGTKIYMKETGDGQPGRITVVYPDGRQVSVDSHGRRTIKIGANVTDIDAQPDGQACRLPPGISLSADGQLHLVNSGIAIDQNCCLKCHDGLRMSLAQNQVHTGNEANGTHAVLTNQRGNTRLNSQDGSTIKMESGGQVSTTTADGQIVTFTPDKHELKTPAGTFHPHEVILWTTQTVKDDGQVNFANGDEIKANGAVSFSDGTRFEKDGTIRTGDGRTASCNYSPEELNTTRERVKATYTKALELETGLNGKTDFDISDIGSLENSISELSTSINALSSRGFLKGANRLMSLRAELQAILERGRQSLAVNNRQNHGSGKVALVSDLNIRQILAS